MTSETVELSTNEVACLFCGTRITVPASRRARRRKAAEANFRVSIVRCHTCGKEAPYQISSPADYQEEAKAAGASGN
jgi:RNase P subunit RPR2